MAIELDAEQVGKPITDKISLVSIHDRYSTYPSKGLTPERLASLLREADAGDVYRQMELFEEMLEKDGHLFSTTQQRRLRVSSRNYNIIATADDPKSKEIASEAGKMIARIRGWQNCVNDLLDSVFKGYAISQILWKKGDGRYDVAGLRWIHQKKARFGKASDPYSDPEELRLILDPNQITQFRGILPESELSRASTDGISLDADPRLRRSFVITYCRARSGNPGRTSLLRTCTYLYLFKNYDVKWWIQFAEVLLGYRIGKYDSAQPDQKELLETALAGLATDSAAVISKDSEIEFVEMAQKAQSHLVYGDLKEWCNDEMTEVVLGHVAATKGTPGKLGEEDVTKEIIQQLVEADARVVDEAITDQIIVPWIEYNYGLQETYPYYKTDVEKAENLLEKADLMLKVQQAGYVVSKKWAKDTFGIPPPNPDDPEDEPLQPGEPPGTFLPGTNPRLIAAEDKKKLLTKR